MAGAPRSGGYERGERVAIPRLDRGPPPPPVPKPSAKDRIARACQKCRKRKIKCSGDGPPCSACQASSLECKYEQARRDRLREATQHNAVLSALLRDLSGRVSSDDQAKIHDTLAELRIDSSSQERDSTQASLGKRGRRRSNRDEEAQKKLGEAYSSGAAGSNEGLDHFEESGRTSFFGKNSEVQWLNSVQRQTAHSDVDQYGESSRPPGLSPNAVVERVIDLHEQRKQTFQHVPEDHTTSPTFYLDSDELKSNRPIDIDAIPQSDEAQRLFTCYIDTVHPSFQLVNDDFLHEFSQYMNARDREANFSLVWRAQLNLIFAVSAKYSHTVNAEWAADACDHISYMERAAALLQIADNLIVPGLKVRTVQATGALAFYFLAIGHVSRAWLAIGRSLRLALALGLHLRNEDPNAAISAKEELVRLWWTLHSIECLISATTGRPPVLAIKDATVPLPRSLKQYPSTMTGEMSREPLRTTRASRAPHSQHSSLEDHKSLVDHVNLMRILQKAMLDLYSPGIASQPWQNTQTSISQLLKTLEIWSQAVSFDLVASRRQKRSDLDRMQRLLTIEYWSTKTIITRPCLCRNERMDHQSNNSAQFDMSTARNCVESALEITYLFPDEGDFNFIGTYCPWWATTHYIVQAIAVLLLETTYDIKKNGTTMQEKITAVKKMLRWLRYMERSDPVAAKAHQVVRGIIQSFTPRLQIVVDELLTTDQVFNDPAQVQHYQNADQILQRESSFDLLQASPSAKVTFDPQSFHHETTETVPFPSDTMFDPEAFLQGSHGRDYGTSYNQNIDPGLYYGDQIPIGNTFLTNFDQDAPFADLQDLWAQPLTPVAYSSD